jgi:hypothetical protein
MERKAKSGDKIKMHNGGMYISFLCVILFFVWTQDLHSEPLHQPFFCEGFFQDRISQSIGLNINNERQDCEIGTTWVRVCVCVCVCVCVYVEGVRVWGGRVNKWD